MPKDYAIVWTTTRSYMPGSNASLNALEHYGFDLKNIDPFVLVWSKASELPSEYRNQWPNVIFADVPTDFFPGKDAYFYLVLGQFAFALEHLKDYKCVLFWGGDLCIVNNFEVYFEIATKTNRIVLGSNEQGVDSFSKMKIEWPYNHTWDVPYTDVPLFVPQSQMDAIRLTIDYQYEPGCELDMMDGLNFAIRDLQIAIYTVPGCLWVMNAPQWTPVKRTDDKLYVLKHRMNSFHRRYWDKSYAAKYIKDMAEPAPSNAKIFNWMYRFLNTQCRVKWTENLETI